VEQAKIYPLNGEAGTKQMVGNALLIVALVAMVYKMGSTLSKVNPWIALAALLLAVGSLMAVRLLLLRRSSTVQTLAIANANRHVGLVLLLAGQQIHDQRLVPAIAAYALAAALVMGLYAKSAPAEYGGCGGGSAGKCL